MALLSEVDVFIVGAGPVGLFFANECARRGLTYRIIETQPTQSQHSKALAIFPRTFEIFDMIGIAKPFAAEANRVTDIAFVSHQRVLGHIDFAPSETPYPYVAMVPQDTTERLLVEHLRAQGGDVEYSTTFVTATQTASGVEATIERDGKREMVSAKYLVGCDGAHSTVRHLLGLQFEGAEYADSYMLADVMTNQALPAQEMQLCPSERGPVAIFPMSATRRRFLAMVDKVEDTAPSLALVQELIAERGPQDFEATSLVWSTYFRIHHRAVAQMQIDRMFVAGDAAHIHSPFGGQGMNTGLQDAWNLVWKLDFAVRGLAQSALLESYTPERYPIVKGVLETTHALTAALGSHNRLVQGVRDTVIPFVTHLPQFQHAFVERLSGLANSYHGSPIVRGAGQRYFDASMRDGNFGRRFAVFTNSNDGTHTFPDAVEIRHSAASGLRLVRPDGYVAFASTSSDTGAWSELSDVLRMQLVGLA